MEAYQMPQEGRKEAMSYVVKGRSDGRMQDH